MLDKSNSDSNFLEAYRAKMETFYKSLDPRLVAQIPLTKSMFAIVDKDVSHEVNKIKWHSNVITQYQSIHARGYFGPKSKVKSLQRFVTELVQLREGNFKEIKQITFSNKLTLDCRSENIDKGHGRQAVMRARRGKKNTSSRFKGVRRTFNKAGNFINFRGQISTPELGNVDLGGFDNETDCALYYDAAAVHLFGKSAAPRNLPDEPITLELMRYIEARLVAFKDRKKLSDAKKAEEDSPKQ